MFASLFFVMKIFAFSDVTKWKGYEELVDRIQPDVVALAGDLTSDGFASFWNEAVEQIREFQKEKQKLMHKFKIIQKSASFYKGGGKDVSEFFDKLDALRTKYCDTEEFRNIRKRMHVDKFYQFLRYAGEKSQVLVVKGDHDEDFKGDYVPEMIDDTSGCREISGKSVEIGGVRFLGLGFNETHYLRILKPTIEKYKGKVDVVITHCEQNKMPLVGSLKPRIVIRGHFGSGKYLVNDVPAVFTMGVKYTVIELKNRDVSKILQYVVGRDNKTKLLKKGSCRPWFSEVSEFERYKWLRPYPN